VASLDAILESGDSKRMTDALTKQYAARISDNERRLEQIRGFKASLCESLMDGLISKDDFKTLKAKYAEDESKLNTALESLRQELDDVLAGKGERLRWTESFKRFEKLTELDRRIVVNLIQSIRVLSKTELEITFNYQSEYECAVSLLDAEVA
jgi:hypothetical protein